MSSDNSKQNNVEIELFNDVKGSMIELAPKIH